MIEFVYTGVAITSFVFLSGLAIGVVIAGIAMLISALNRIIESQAEYRAAKYRNQLVHNYEASKSSTYLSQEEKDVWGYLISSFSRGELPTPYQYKKEYRDGSNSS